MRETLIFLTGFMGSGKTTMGKRLARILNRPFLDLDSIVESRQGMDIKTLFNTIGEESFRQAEADALRNLEAEAGAVVATGGGTPCYNDNMKYMLERGMVVYVQLNTGALVSRLRKGKDRRPLIAGIPANDMWTWVDNKLAEREPFYLMASIVFDGMNSDVAELAKIIREKES